MVDIVLCTADFVQPQQSKIMKIEKLLSQRFLRLQQFHHHLKSRQSAHPNQVAQTRYYKLISTSCLLFKDFHSDQPFRQPELDGLTKFSVQNLSTFVDVRFNGDYINQIVLLSQSVDPIKHRLCTNHHFGEQACATEKPYGLTPQTQVRPN
ncbi:Hypothetical_protein [Hexamita inflata]|uniref:Hypothetical_protein n=1 Tax=Hexamita inflata TaxID=28002 RepID=A0AA86PUA3_9EUKA|nr:Hypothetical protein HINF_LOCUS32742 [Hexamita inflata]CAI9945098.1 Hypothetical protein HINF_LOCUS32743 [Hexamita inflata]CAI9945099.1 Hypothetical protein HINF_LOCUS32744 [Hexamita inflata]